jgi:hypothetical protein
MIKISRKKRKKEKKEKEREKKKMREKRHILKERNSGVSIKNRFTSSIKNRYNVFNILYDKNKCYSKIERKEREKREKREKREEKRKREKRRKWINAFFSGLSVQILEYTHIVNSK